MKNLFPSQRLIYWFFLAVILASQALHAQDDISGDRIYEEVLVTGGAGNIRTLSGSAALIDETQIAKFDSVDITSLLTQIPGVYLRIEDGYGLRPNIGLRGATSERSQKITLMEDGILIAPAPYSAPAAYYMPNVNRMSSVEVFKGPASIKYGPHTVGGAINMVTPPMPLFGEGRLEATFGTDNFQKHHVVYGDSVGQWGYQVDALHYGSDGFKELDSGQDTGFERNDFNAKLQWSSDNSADVYQQLQLKLGYADEDSSETYLGLSDTDFHLKSERRYVSSELDTFKSKHWQAQLIYYIDLANDWQLTSKLYYNHFDRSWVKFDGFMNSSAAPVSVVLANPTIYEREMGLIRGDVDSDGSQLETIDVTDFDREYASSGIDVRAKHQHITGALLHNLEAGIRYHYDYVERDHTPNGYLMQSSRLAYAGITREMVTSNKWKTDAIALFISDSIEYRGWKIDLGLRYEYIDGETKDYLAGTRGRSEQDILLPGLGVYYQFTEHWGFLAGINKGFSPASPGGGDGVHPEESVSYEYGVRYHQDDLAVDLIGFFSDYDNLLGRCRVSDPGCTVGEEFSGGKIQIAGTEFTANYTVALGNSLLMPISLVYTYTESAFQSTFTSKFSQWNPGYFDGVQRPVRQGDELPYTPDHQARVQVGLAGLNWSADLAFKYISEMRELPGRGDYKEGEYTRALHTVDFAASYNVTDHLEVRLVAENISNKSEIVSRRPFGARPNQPRSFKLGFSYAL